MSEIIIKQAQFEDIPTIQSILLDTVNWLNEMNQPLWKAEDVVWSMLSKSYFINDFYIAFIGGSGGQKTRNSHFSDKNCKSCLPYSVWSPTALAISHLKVNQRKWRL